MLTRLDDELWTLVRPYQSLGLTLASRMTVVRLTGDELLLHSPVRLTEDLRRALDALGPVRHLVAPNRMHHLFCGGYRDVYPSASLWGAPGLPAKRRDLRFAGELTCATPMAWSAVMEQTLVEGFPLLNEVVFVHKPSKTVILTDLAANGCADDPPALRAWLRLNGAYGRPRTTRAVRLLCRDRAAARRGVERILDWAFDRVIVAHGAIIETAGRRRIEEAFAWLS